MATTFLQNDAFNFTYFLCYVLSGHLACFQFFDNIKEYLNSCEGKGFTRRKLNCISTLVRPKSFLRILVRAVLNFLNPYIIIFNFYVSVRQENAGRKWYQDVIQLLHGLHKELPRIKNYGTFPLSWTFFKKLPTHSTPLRATTESQNDIYGICLSFLC